ncbi:MAG: type II secretion system F family protein, partial [Silicimonas sp.]|nr:type II secretion system F family protein [Silicimonas sp.]
GQGAAATQAELAAQLSREGLVLVSARPAGKGQGFSALAPRRKVKLAALSAFTREFRSLVGAGMPMAAALQRLETRKDDALLAAAVADARRKVEQGVALDRAMADNPTVFDPLFQTTVRAGLATGQLETALDRLLSFMAMRQQLDQKVRRATRYPLFLMGLLAIVLAILMLFVLPRFADLYAEFDTELPWLTRMLIAGVESAPIWVPALAVVVLGLVALLRLMASLPATQMGLDRFRLALPLFGPIRQETGRIQVSFMLSMLLSAGVTLRDALNFAGKGATNSVYQAAVFRIEDAISRGQTLAAALKRETLFPDLSVSLLEVGETAGDLDRMFTEVAKLHEERLENRLNRTLALLEPAMMLFVGIVLGSVIVAVYLPIFGISSVIQ